MSPMRTTFLQFLIVDILSHALVPEIKDDQNFMQLLDLPVEELCIHQLWLQNLTPQQNFSIKVLATCCYKIAISDTLEWLNNVNVILKLCKVFNIFWSKKNPNQIIFCGDIPKEVSNHLSSSVQK